MRRRIGCAVAGQIAFDLIGGVGVRVEVHYADVAVAVHIGNRGRRGPGDRVIAAEDDGHDAARRHGVHALADVVVRDLGLTVGAVRVAEIDDFEPVEDLETQIQVIGARLVGSGTDGARAEPGTRPVRCRDVERRTDDRHIGSPRLQLFGLGEKRPVPERRHPGVGQVELLYHSRRKLSLMIVVVTH